MATLAARHWVPPDSERLVQAIAQQTQSGTAAAVAAAIDAAIALNRRIHERDCVNLNPATNTMNPRAEAALAAGLSARVSLGYPGDKYEMGLEGVERIEATAAALAAEVFGARFAEVRVPSGAMANLFAFVLATRPGDAVIVPPAAIGGHVTHHAAGCAGLYGLAVHEAAVDPAGYALDLPALRAQAHAVRPKLITVGGSLNLCPHPVAEVRAIAEEVGALVLFDAAHLCGMVAGRIWPNPLDQGAHVMTMSTYKSLGGPAGGLVLTNDPALAERLDAIAYPGLTANFDAGRTAALAITLLDWRAHGAAYAAAMVATAQALAAALEAHGLPVFTTRDGATGSHQFALRAAGWGGGQAMARRLRAAGILASGIGLPAAAVAGDMNGLRLGTPEIVRWGMTPADMPELAGLLARALHGNAAPDALAAEAGAFRRRFTKLHFLAET